MAKRIKVKTILEAHYSGLSTNEIARTRQTSKHSVRNVLVIARELGISSLDDIASKTEDELYSLFFPSKSENLPLEKVDYELVHKELNRTGVTLKLLWREYCGRCAAKKVIPVSYVTFTRGYSEFIGKFILLSPR